jgi:hypothetical protein
MTTDSVRVRVRDGWIVFDGQVQLNGGDTVTVDRKTADKYVADGLVDIVPSARRKRR